MTTVDAVPFVPRCPGCKRRAAVELDGWAIYACQRCGVTYRADSKLGTCTAFGRNTKGGAQAWR